MSSSIGPVERTGVARRFEEKHLKLTLGLSIESLRFRDGCAAAFSGPGGYANRVVGWTMTPEDLDPAIAFFSERNEDTKVEVSTFASNELLSAIAARSFVLRSFAHLLAAPARAVELLPVAGVSIGRLDRTDPVAVRSAATHNERCFATPESPASEMAITLTSRHLAMPTNDTFLARRDGEVIGVGCSESSDGVTLLFGGAVVPAERGQGIQRALLATRVALAVERGSEVLTMLCGPGTPSERNGFRAGFQLVGARAYFTRSRR